MTVEDVEALVTAYREGRDPDGEGGVHVRLVSQEEIEANDWDLNIGRRLARCTALGFDLSWELLRESS